MFLYIEKLAFAEVYKVLFIIFIFIECIGVTLVNKII